MWANKWTLIRLQIMLPTNYLLTYIYKEVVNNFIVSLFMKQVYPITWIFFLTSFVLRLSTKPISYFLQKSFYRDFTQTTPLTFVVVTHFSSSSYPSLSLSFSLLSYLSIYLFLSLSPSLSLSLSLTICLFTDLFLSRYIYLYVLSLSLSLSMPLRRLFL